ncbi:MAG: hypothetical protein HZC45_02050 [Deltaproteobacteria bacterium]|nr:hypothetical protein [Deltaproteobacteria bacterium]
MGVDNAKDKDVIDAMKKGVGDTIGMIDEICERLKDCSNLLRIEQGKEVFNSLSQGIENIKSLLDLINELNIGIGYLSTSGYSISKEIFSNLDKTKGVFNEMLSAFEGKDWITVADIMEYEINPILLEIKKGLDTLNDRLTQIGLH